MSNHDGLWTTLDAQGHDSQEFVTDASDLRGALPKDRSNRKRFNQSHPPCPICEQPVAIEQRHAKRDCEGEIAMWVVYCPLCDAKLVVFND